MAKRKKDSGPVDDLYEVAALLPWWLDVAIAGAAFAGLRHVAEAKTASGAKPMDPGHIVSSTIWPVFAMVGQFLIPLVFLLGAVASILRRSRRRELLAKAGRSTGTTLVHAMSWQEFELLVGEVFRRRGYKVEERGGRGPDGGVDLIVRRGGESALVQCKHWRSKQVGVSVVRELLGSMSVLGATAGSVVTSGRFTAAARLFAADQGLELLDGEALRSLASGAPASGSRTGTAVVEPPTFDGSLDLVAASEVSPACPVCARTMVTRTARRGAMIGSKFWGCPAFPNCRGTRWS